MIVLFCPGQTKVDIGLRSGQKRCDSSAGAHKSSGGIRVVYGLLWPGPQELAGGGSVPFLMAQPADIFSTFDLSASSAVRWRSRMANLRPFSLRLHLEPFPSQSVANHVTSAATIKRLLLCWELLAKTSLYLPRNSIVYP